MKKSKDELKTQKRNQTLRSRADLKFWRVDISGDFMLCRTSFYFGLICFVCVYCQKYVFNMYMLYVMYEHLCSMCVKMKAWKPEKDVRWDVLLCHSSYFLKMGSLNEHRSKLVIGVPTAPSVSLLPYSARLQVHISMPGFLHGLLWFEARCLFLHRKWS